MSKILCFLKLLFEFAAIKAHSKEYLCITNGSSKAIHTRNIQLFNFTLNYFLVSIFTA